MNQQTREQSISNTVLNCSEKNIGLLFRVSALKIIHWSKLNV